MTSTSAPAAAAVDCSSLRPYEPARDAASPNRNLTPVTTAVDAEGRLVVGGCVLSDLARRYGTPLYVLDEATLRGTARAYRSALACGWLVVDELHITAVATSPDRKREGLGQRVLQALLAEGGQKGARHATLEVSTTNAAANALYARCGFRTAGIRHGYYRNGDDALIQWLRLEERE